MTAVLSVLPVSQAPISAANPPAQNPPFVLETPATPTAIILSPDTITALARNDGPTAIVLSAGIGMMLVIDAIARLMKHK